jgi:hypothetical protein
VVKRLGAVGAICIGALIAAGCGIPTQPAPSAIAPNRVPFGLLSPVLPTTTTTLPRASVKIYFFGPHRRLEAVTRVVPIKGGLNSIITSLLAGPNSSEMAAGVTTAIPNGVGVVSVTVNKAPGPVTVNFNAAFGQITGSALEAAVSQVVATVVAQSAPGTGVIFEVAGVPTTVPIANGTRVSGPVYLSQF